MIAQRIRAATQLLHAPRGAPEEVRSLWVRVVPDDDLGIVVESAWEPTPGELELLNAGGVVVLRVLGGGQPPVQLTVVPPEPEAPPET